MSEIPNCEWALRLPEDQIPKALALIAALQGALAARLATPAPSRLVPNALVDARELAQRLGVPESHIRTLQRAGAIPCVRVGAKYIRFDIAAVAAALAVSK